VSGLVAGVEAQQRREMRAQITTGELVRQETIEDQDAQERLHPWVGKGQRAGALIADLCESASLTLCKMRVSAVRVADPVIEWRDAFSTTCRPLTFAPEA